MKIFLVLYFVTMFTLLFMVSSWQFTLATLIVCVVLALIAWLHDKSSDRPK